MMSKSYYRVFFLSNSQPNILSSIPSSDVKELLSCFLFKQFTTGSQGTRLPHWMSKSYYRVFFLSNSQPALVLLVGNSDVKELLSCFLFKQFTTVSVQ